MTDQGSSPSARSTTSDASLAAIVLFGVLVALAYMTLTAAYAVNMPFWDDFTLFGVYSDDPAVHVEWLLAPNNEHIIAVPKLVALATRLATGSVDFRILCLIGAGLLVIAASLLARSAYLDVERPAVFALVLATLLSPRAWENMTWALSGLQNNGVVLLAALTFVLARRGGPASVIGGLTVILVALFTSGSGVILLVMYPCAVLWDRARRVPQREGGTGVAGGLLACFVGVVAATLWIVAMQGESAGATFEPTAFVSAAPVIAVRFLVTIGSFAYAPSVFGDGGAATAVSLAAGTALFAHASLSLWRRRHERPTLHGLMALFAILSAAAAAAGRADLGLRQAASGRYAVLSLLILVHSAVVLGQNPRRMSGRGRAIVLAAALALLLGAWDGLVELRERRDMLLASRASWIASRTGLCRGEGMVEVEGIFVRAVDAGRFSLPR